MALLIESEIEILPGYRLLTKLGSGGYGEVWKCEAPGGLHKAIKIVHADIGSGANLRTEQELSALRRVQAVRHPYLLSIERYDVIDGRLVIVTELADCNLWDRFTEYRQLRQAGIPREDLLRYMLEAAEVLDLMNSQYQLQHLDIKPQNLFLVHDHVKVADFGLVRDLDGTKRANEGGATPIYAAPETFEGMATPYCDQYSLAIVYQELLTGKRPFSGTTLQQLIAQHLQAAPDLNSLPPTDRPAVAKALSKRPEDRHATCREFVRLLLAGGMAAVTPHPSMPLQPTLPTVLPSPDAILEPENWSSDTPRTQVLFNTDDEHQQADVQHHRMAPELKTGDGVLFPAVIIGIGGLALGVLRRTKRAIAERFGSVDRLPNIRFLFIDTDPETAQKATDEGGDGALSSDEVFAARLNRPAHYLKPRRNGRSILEGWFDSQVLYRIKAGNPLTQGLRSLGRLAFCDHYRAFEQKIKHELEVATNPESMDHAETHSQLGLRTNKPRVYVVAGMGGGTGSGMFIDVAYAVRQQLRTMGHLDPELVGLFLLPPHNGPSAKTQSVGNTFAALTELNHFSFPGITYTACIDDKDMTLVDQDQPFSRFVLLPLRPPLSQTNNAPGVGKLAEFLWRDLATPFGNAADCSRAEVLSMPGVSPDPMTIAGQSFGLHCLSWPRQQLADRTARWLCLSIVERWQKADNQHLIEPVNAWAKEQWTKHGFYPEALAQMLQNAAEQALGESFDRHVADLTDPFTPRSRWSRGAYDPTAAFQTLNKLVQLVGPPGEMSGNRQGARLESAMASCLEPITRDWCAGVAQLALCLIEQPDYRLAGAETAIVAMQQLANQALQRFEAMTRERAEQADHAYRRAQQLIETDSRRRAGAELAESFRQFAGARYQYLMGRCVVHVYGLVGDLLADSLKEIGQCRNLLGDLAERLNPGPPESTPSGTLLPEGCKTLEEVVDLYRQSIDAAALAELERQIQLMVDKQYGSLAHVCLASAEVRATLESAMLDIAGKFMMQRLGKVDVTGLFLQRYADPERAHRAVTRAYSHSNPWLEAPDAPADFAEILAVTASPNCQPFLHLVAAHLPNANPTIAASPDDVIFYREQVTVPLKCLPQLGNIGRSAYEQLLHQQFPPHTRIDIRQWYEVG